MPINCVAIDDDALSLENLTAYVREFPTLRMVKSYTDPVAALKEIAFTDDIDIIFMDIEMPTISGIELAGLIRTKTKYLIFTTAHTKYAIDAFKVNADAYLLKPFTSYHVSSAIHKLFPNQPSNTTFNGDKFFFVPASAETKMLKIDFKDLVSIEKIDETIHLRTLEHHYSNLKLNYTKIIDTLKNHPAFIEVNSSAIISKLHIKSVLGKQITLSGGFSVLLAQNYRDAVFSFINQNLLNGTVLKD